MIGKGIIAVYLLSTGFMGGDFAHMVRGAPSEKVRIPASVVVIHHSSKGWGLFDTGLGEDIEKERSHLPEAIGQWLLPVAITPADTVRAQITSLGLTSKEIRWILLSHLHHDHTGGLKDFQAARVYVDRREWEARGRGRWGAVRHGQIFSHLQAVEIQVEPLNLEDATPLGDFRHAVDLFGDGTLFVLSTPGHTPGHVSLLIHSSGGDFLFTGDVAWTMENIEGPTPKGRAVSYLEEWDRTVQQESLQRIHDFWKGHPETKVIPSHDPHLWPQLPHLPAALFQE